MIPETLTAWTVDVVRLLLAQGVFENDRFDFKEKLPHKSNESDKLGLSKTCAAFANAGGGYLVYGVKDDKGLTPEQRLVGFDPREDFPEHFGNYPAAAEPSIEWSFRMPALLLENQRFIHIVRIDASGRKPHAVLDHDRWWLGKRTSKGNEVMSYEEIRLAFQDTETRRTKLALLASELANIGWIAERLLNEVPDQAPVDGLILDWAWMTRYPTTLVYTVLGDAFSLMTDKTDLWAALAMLRDETRRANAVADMYSNYGFVRSSADGQQRAKLYRLMRESATKICSCVRHGKKMVDAVLSGNYGKRLDVAEDKQ